MKPFDSNEFFHSVNAKTSRRIVDAPPKRADDMGHSRRVQPTPPHTGTVRKQPTSGRGSEDRGHAKKLHRKGGLKPGYQTGKC
jgi:hypothetical protein